MIPKSEYSDSFWEKMKQRVGVSYHKYGPIKKATGDFLANAELRLKEYRKTGNADFLMDVANFVMFEFMHPQHPDAHYRPTDSHESPGLVFEGERKPLKDTDNQGNPLPTY